MVEIAAGRATLEDDEHLGRGMEEQEKEEEEESGAQCGHDRGCDGEIAPRFTREKFAAKMPHSQQAVAAALTRLDALERDAAQIEAALRAALQPQEPTVAGGRSAVLSAVSPAAVNSYSPPSGASSTSPATAPVTPPSGATPIASSLRVLEQLHEARAQVAALEQRNAHLSQVTDGLLRPYGKLKGVVEWWSTLPD